jgi:DHA1 family bicyclomycin/chloramphenicol resistance-like MFS transporter
MNSSPERAPTHSVWLLTVLSALMAFASISTDLYLPAMPVMARNLSAGTGTMEWTVSAYLVGFSLGQLFWGPIGDRVGRRLPIALGLIIFTLGSAGCALAVTSQTLIVARVIQAVGACASVVLARAMVRDLYAGATAAKMLSTLMTVMAVAPLLGPTIGGQILLVGTWQGIFWLLAAVGIVALIALATVPETLALERRQKEPLGSALRKYAGLLADPRFRSYAGCSGLFYGGMYAYVAGTPFAYITFHGVSAQHYGLLFAAGIVGVMATNLLNARWVTRFGADTLMHWGATAAAAAAVLGIAAVEFAPHTLWPLASALFLFVGSTGFIVANAVAGALDTAPDRAGAVSALIGAIQYGSGIAGSAIVGLCADGTPRPLATVVAVMALGSLLYAGAASRSPATNIGVPDG